MYIVEPGKFEFSKPSYIIRESNECAQIFVNRVNGADGTVTVRWRTKDLTALHNKDYVGGDGTLTFEHGETSKSINLKILETNVSSLKFADLLLSWCLLYFICKIFLNMTLLTITVYNLTVPYLYVSVYGI